MALTVATNSGALMAQAAASSVNKEMGISMERLSTGKRINSAADDAAGVAIASRLTSEIRGTNQSIRNAMDAQALIDTAEGAHIEITNILQRMREISVQAANDTNNIDDRDNLEAEMTHLSTEIDRISQTTTWAGKELLNGVLTGNSGSGTGDATLDFHVGSRTGTADTITTTIGSMRTSVLGVAGDTTVNATGSNATVTISNNNTSTFTLLMVTSTNAVAAVTIDGVAFSETHANGASAAGASHALDLASAINAHSSLAGFTATVSGLFVDIAKEAFAQQMANRTDALAVVDTIDAALKTVMAQRATLGSTSNRFDHTVSNLTNIATNLSEGKGRIEDADFAAETTSLARTQILQQASTAMLAQANASKQNVLSLLQG